jgi:hypothetical protein
MAVGHKILSSNYHRTTKGTRVLVIEESWISVSDTEGKVFRRLVFFSLSLGVTDLDFQTHPSAFILSVAIRDRENYLGLK